MFKTSKLPPTIEFTKRTDMGMREVFKIPPHTIYGYRIDYVNQTVTYLEDAVGMTPAYMDYVNDEFNYGSWEDAFFMPRPCMLNRNGTVAYYLDENDYTKREDGVTPSDIADDTFAGNAMMEWGRNGRQIWYKQVTEIDDTVSIYIADYKIDDDYHAWSFYDANGKIKEHFYTPIYNGTIDSSDTLRSISGKTYADYCKSKTATAEITSAEKNNVGTDKGWYTETNADFVLISHLLVLIGKSLDTSTTFGNGRSGQESAQENMLDTGTMNDKGMFWGSNTGTYGVKVFGMENYWGNQWRRFAGLILRENVWYYKLTRGTQDGSNATDYNTTGEDYLTLNHTAPATNYVTQMFYTDDGAVYDRASGSSSASMYKDYFYKTATSNRYALRGGYCNSSALYCGAFCFTVNGGAGYASWAIGSSLSYR